MLNGETPPKCEACPIAQLENLDKHGISLVRNCPGPEPGFNEEEHPLVRIRRGIASSELVSRLMIIVDADGSERQVGVVPSIDGSEAAAICRNSGLILSLNLAREKGKE